MRKLTILFAALALLSSCANAPADPTISDVYFTEQISPESFNKIFAKIEKELSGKVGVKVHFGEEGNAYYVKPDLYKDVILKIDGTFIETNVLYKSVRQNTETHIALAKEHGFTYAPIDILDADGGKIISNVDGTRHYSQFYLGKHLDNYDHLLILSHFKGHGSSGFGGAIKNVSMGFATPQGKLAMHKNNVPVVNDQCTNCGQCQTECPNNAITIHPFSIDRDLCIGCGKCIDVCPSKALRMPEDSEMHDIFCERLVEYAKAVQDHHKMVYINVLIDISPNCDCVRRPGKPFVPNIGILASTDIVAIEKASHDLVAKAHQCAEPFLEVNHVSGLHQIDYAYQLGMGNKNYRLINIDTQESTVVKVGE